jgi:ribose 5-phosphate isomerase B
MIYIAADHAGFELKEKVKILCTKYTIQVVDLTPSFVPGDDYPDVAQVLADTLRNGEDEDLGISVCGTAEGMVMALNRFNHIRAAFVDTPHLAKMIREHNHANVLCLPGPYAEKNFSDQQLLEILETFANTFPDQDARHVRRIHKLTMLHSSRENP